MKINYSIKTGVQKQESFNINVVGGYVISLVSGQTRDKGKLYEVILDPKTKKHDPNRMWYIGDNGYPVNCLAPKFKTFRKATQKEIDDYEDQL